MVKNIHSDFSNQQGHKSTLTVDTTKPLLLIDIDGTLVNAKKIHAEVIQKQYFKRFDVKVNPLHWFEVFGLGDRLEHATLMKRYHISYDKTLIETVCQEYARMFENILKKSSFKERREFLIPGALPFLTWAHRNGIPMAIVTGNVKRTGNAMLKYLNLSKYFTAGGFGDDPGVIERPDIIRSALKKCVNKGLCKEPKQTYIIGDTPHDALSAFKVNQQFKPVLIATGDFSLKKLKTDIKTTAQIPEPLFFNNLLSMKKALQRRKILV